MFHSYENNDVLRHHKNFNKSLNQLNGGMSLYVRKHAIIGLSAQFISTRQKCFADFWL
jgi:hypothetical protein